MNTNLIMSLREFFMFHYLDSEILYTCDNSVIIEYDGFAVRFLNSFYNLKEKLLHFDITSDNMRAVVYDAAKPFYGDGKDDLRRWFSDMNLICLNKKDGPSLAEFIKMYGIEEFIAKVENRLKNPILFFAILGV